MGKLLHGSRVRPAAVQVVFRTNMPGLRVQGSGFRVQGLGFRVERTGVANIAEHPLAFRHSSHTGRSCEKCSFVGSEPRFASPRNPKPQST